MANETDKMTYIFYLILISLNLNLNCYMWLVATILVSANLD